MEKSNAILVRRKSLLLVTFVLSVVGIVAAIKLGLASSSPTPPSLAHPFFLAIPFGFVASIAWIVLCYLNWAVSPIVSSLQRIRVALIHVAAAFIAAFWVGIALFLFSWRAVVA